MKKLIVIAALAAATTAHAWGQREQEVLAGAAVGALVVGAIVNSESGSRAQFNYSRDYTNRDNIYVDVQGSYGYRYHPRPWGLPVVIPRPPGPGRHDYAADYPSANTVYFEQSPRCPYSTQEFFKRGFDRYGNTHYIFSGCR